MKQAKKNWLIFTPGSLQYCSQNYCTVVPEMTVFLFAEITAFLFPVYRRGIMMRCWGDGILWIRWRMMHQHIHLTMQCGIILF